MSFFKAHLGTLIARKQPFQQFENAVLADGGTFDKALLLSEWAGQPAAVKEKATIALVSGAYKSGKIYGFMPQSGNVVPFTFSRAGTATYFDKNGVVQTAAANMPRIDYDPVTKECKGYLIESASTNLVYNLNQPAWSLGRAGKILNFGLAPDGTMSSTKITAALQESGGQYVGTSINMADLSSRSFTFSVWLKSDSNKPLCKLYTYGSPGTEDVKSKDITITNQWQRFTMTFTFKAGMVSGALWVRIDLPPLSPVGDYFEAWGAQLEESSVVSSYIPTSTAQVTRVADSLTLAGLYTNLPELSMFVDLNTKVQINIGVIQKIGVTNQFLAISGAKQAAINDGAGGYVGVTGAMVDDTRTKIVSSYGSQLKIAKSGAVAKGAYNLNNFYNSFAIGFRGLPTQYRSIAIFPTQLSDADHITLTT